MSWQSHVHPHGPLRSIAPRLWEVTGTAPRSPVPRNMAVHRLDDGSLMLHSVVALDDPTQTEVEALGDPSVMVVPSALHRMDAAVYKERYPALAVTCPRAALDKVQERVPVDGVAEDVLPELGVRCHAIAGTKPGELVYEVDAGNGRALLMCDVLFNLREHQKGLHGFVLRYITASTGFFGMSRLGRLLMLSDRAEFRTWLLELANEPDLSAILVGHGDPIVEDCAARLREAAQRL